MVNLPADHEAWAELKDAVQKVISDFCVEFESSPLRTSVGRAQKGLGKLAADPNLESKIQEAIFAKLIPADAVVGGKSDEVKAALAVQCFGFAKNVLSCVPEKGHMATVTFMVSGSCNVIAFPLVAVLEFFAGQQSKPDLPFKDVLPLLKCANAEMLRDLLKSLQASQSICHCTCGPNDLLYLPTSWITVQATGAADALGLKARFILPSLKDAMQLLEEKLLVHGSPSDLLSSCLKGLQPESG